MQKKYTTALFSLLLSCFIYCTIAPTLTFATTASSSANGSDSSSPSASPEETTMELKKRIEKVVEEKREQIKGAISNLLSDKHGFIGEVSRLSQEAITVKVGGDSKIIPITEGLVIIQKGKKISAEQIEVGNWVTVIGNGSADKFNPEYILVSTESLRPQDKVVTLGSITKVSKTTITLKQRGSTEEREFQILKSSKFENVDGTAIKPADFEEDLSALVIAVKNDKDTWDIIRIRSLTDVKSSN